MKKLIIIFSLLVFLLVACDKTEEEAKPTLRDKLIKTWSLTGDGYVKASGVNITNSFTDLSFTFNADDTYSSSVNTKETSGVWRPTDSSFSTIILDDATTINILELSEGRLLISFTSEGMINAKEKGVSTFEVLLTGE